VLGAEIGIALVLAVLLTFVFTTELGIAGILEYPIDFRTDFDTFDNWGENQGEWYDSLKIYAETIKTTNQLAGQNNLGRSATSSRSGPRIKRSTCRASSLTCCRCRVRKVRHKALTSRSSTSSAT
jgi:hypothetical protein